MKNKFKNVPIRLVITVAILILLIALINISPATLGRYTTSFGREFNFVTNAKQTLNVSYGEWEEVTQSKKLTFNMACANGEAAGDATARVRLYLPDASALPSQILISSGETQCMARLSEIREGTHAHKTYGAGVIGCFYDENGNELTLEVLQSAEEGVNATLVLVGDSLDTTGIRVIVDTISKSDEGGGE